MRRSATQAARPVNRKGEANLPAGEGVRKWLRGGFLRKTARRQKPRLARQSSTAPAAWKMKFGSQTMRCGAHSGRFSRA